MDLDHDYDRGGPLDPALDAAAVSTTTRRAVTATHANAAKPASTVIAAHTRPTMITPDVSTPLLRHCTALATQARVELLTRSQHTAADGLRVVLEQICAWDPHLVSDPDPTMLALAAAALADLEQRIAQSSAHDLAPMVSAATALLHDLLARRDVSSVA